MADVDLLQRMDEFESRLLRVEELLAVRQPPQLPVLPARPPAMDVSEEEPAEVDAVLELTPDEAEAAPVQAPPIPVMPYRSRAQSKPVSQSALEQTIGLKWAGWVGAVVLVIGAGLGIKFGYDAGWFTVFSPAVRLVIFALAGLGLIATGEWVYRRVNVLSAAGLFGAGVAVLFVVGYSGYAYYDLYPRNAAFVLMGISTVIGALVARRGNMVSIAVLSLVGGNLAPALLAQGSAELTGFLAYLLMLQVVALTLAAWGASPKWWTLRGLSLATTSLWIASVMDQSPLTALIAFTAVFAVLYQLEVLISAARPRLDPPRAGATFSLLVTAGLTAVMLYWMRDSTQGDRLGFVLSLAALTGIAALGCRRGDRPALAELGFGFAVQFLALLVVAVPVALSGIWIAGAWGVLAVALAVLGYVRDLPMARYGAAVVWLLALGELWIWSSGYGIASHNSLVGVSIAGIDFYQHTLMSCLLALLGQLVGKCIVSRRGKPASSNARQVGMAMSIFSSAVWVLACLTGLPTMMATTSVLVYSAMLVGLDFVEIDLNFLAQAAVIALMAILKWVLRDTLGQRILQPPMVQSIFFSLSGLTSAAILINLALLHYRAVLTVQTNSYSKQIKLGVGIATVGVFFWLGTFGIDQAFINLRATAMLTDPGRAEQVALSIFWSVFAVASITAGFGWRVARLRYFGLGLFAVTLLKVMAIDLNQVSTGYRILSFLGLGLLLLGTSVLYGKVSPRLLGKTNVESDPL